MSTWPELHSGTNFNYVWDVNTLVWAKEVQPATVGGGGTADVQYVEQAASAATPTGTAEILISAGGASGNGPLGQIVGADLINVVPRATYKGEQYVKHIDIISITGGQANNATGVSVQKMLPVLPALSNAEAQAWTEDRRVVLSADLNGSLRTTLAPFTLALEYDASNNPIYYGRAVQGSAKSASVWQVQKLTFDGSNNVTDLQFANGSQAYNAIWNNRASLSYS